MNEAKEMRYIRLETGDGESYDILLESILTMDLEGVCERHELYPGLKSLDKTKTCLSVRLVLAGGRDNFQISIYQKLRLQNDIYSIAYLDGDKAILERIYVPWDTENIDCDEENDFQTSEIDKFGNLVIDIKRR